MKQTDGKTARRPDGKAGAGDGRQLVALRRRAKAEILPPRRRDYRLRTAHRLPSRRLAVCAVQSWVVSSAG